MLGHARHASTSRGLLANIKQPREKGQALALRVPFHVRVLYLSLLKRDKKSTHTWQTPKHKHQHTRAHTHKDILLLLVLLLLLLAFDPFHFKIVDRTSFFLPLAASRVPLDGVASDGFESLVAARRVPVFELDHVHVRPLLDQ